MSSDLASGKRPDRHPLDWYVEQAWTARALIEHVDFDREHTVWDPCCGLGTIPATFARAGFKAAGTDIADRWMPWEMPLFLGEHDFLGSQVHLMENWHRLDLVFNPPFSCTEDIAEKFVRKALATTHTGKVCALLPLKWRASEKRYAFFEEFPPEMLVFCDRPSMPPGVALDQRDARGELTAWKRGKVDYAWYHWDRAAPLAAGITRSIKPRTAAQKRADRIMDLRRVRVLPELEEAA